MHIIRKRNIIILLGVFILFLLTTFFINRIAKGKRPKVKDWSEIKLSGRLSIATDKSTTGFQVEDSTMLGLNYEIARHFADKYDLELEVTQITDLNSAFRELENLNIDIVSILLPITTESKKKGAFTTPFFTSQLVLVQNTKNRNPIITTQLELAGDTIYIPQDSPHSLRLNNIKKEIIIDFEVLETPKKTMEENVIAVANGDIRFTICERQLAQTLQIKYEHLDISLPMSFDQSYAWVVNKKATKLLNELNLFIEDFIMSKEYLELYNRYYNFK